MLRALPETTSTQKVSVSAEFGRDSYEGDMHDRSWPSRPLSLYYTDATEPKEHCGISDGTWKAKNIDLSFKRMFEGFP